MAYVSNYTFNDLSRFNDDKCYIDQNAIQNAGYCSYMMQNYFVQDCNMNNAKYMATTQPCINYSGTFGLSGGGCNVDENSKLLIGGIQTHPRSKLDLFARPFATVPYLGRGAVDPMLESQIQQGESITNKRSITKLAERNYLRYHTTPLLPNIKERIQNSAHMIESDASQDWTRGGMSSRDMSKDQK